MNISSTTIEKTNTKATSHQRLVYMTSTALFAAMICITTAYIFHIPFGMNGRYVHVGDSLIYLAAATLPMPYAMIAGAIGGAFADLLTAPIWAPATFIIKMIIALPFTCKKDKYIAPRNVAAVFIAGVLSFTGYYLADVILFGTWGALIPSIMSSLAQSGGSAILFIIFGIALDKMHFKGMLKIQVRLGVLAARCASCFA